MADFPTKADFLRVAKVALLEDQPKLTRLAVETPGTDAWALLQGMAAVGDALMGQAISFQSAYYNASSRGDKLDYKLLDSLALARKRAAVSLCSVDFETDALTLAAFPIEHDTIISDEAGVQWLTTHDATFPKNSRGPLTVRVRSALAGRDQYALPNTISNLITQIPNAPTDLRVTNPRAATVGDDEASDPDYRQSAQRFFDAARRGTLAAIEARALRVPGVKTAVATEVLNNLGLPNKVVLLGITDRFTELLIDQTTVPPVYESQSRVLAQTVQDALADTRSGGSPVFVELASVIVVPVNLNLTFTAGADINDTAYRARVAIVNEINLLRRGQTLSMTTLRDALRRVRGVSFTGNEIAFPIGDVVAKPLQVFRSSLANVTANSVQPDRPLTLSVNADSFG